MVGAMLTMAILTLGQERKAVRRIEQGYHACKQRRAAAEAALEDLRPAEEAKAEGAKAEGAKPEVASPPPTQQQRTVSPTIALALTLTPTLALARTLAPILTPDPSPQP